LKEILIWWKLRKQVEYSNSKEINNNLKDFEDCLKVLVDSESKRGGSSIINNKGKIDLSATQCLSDSELKDSEFVISAKLSKT
jgi:hypothetical protein